MKSFSGNVKSELASDTLKSKVKTCCAFSLIYGIMSFSRLKDGRLFLKTTNAEIKKLFSDICTFLNSRIKFFHESKNQIQYLNHSYYYNNSLQLMIRHYCVLIYPPLVKLLCTYSSLS